MGPIERDGEAAAVVVKEGLVVGVKVRTYPLGPVVCLMEKRICTYGSDDNHGAGYKSRTDYKGLACMPAGWNKR